jgi:DNA-binding PadR family transcriptional regulator
MATENILAEYELLSVIRRFGEFSYEHHGDRRYFDTLMSLHSKDLVESRGVLEWMEYEDGGDRLDKGTYTITQEGKDWLSGNLENYLAAARMDSDSQRAQATS